MVWASAFTPVPQILLARLPCSACWLTSLCNCLGWRPSVKCSSWENFSLSALPGHRAAAPQGRCSPWGGQREVVEDKRCCLSVSPGEGKAVGWKKSLSTALLWLHLAFIFTGEADSGSFSDQAHTKHFTGSAPLFPSACSVFLPLPAFLEVLCPLRSPHPGVNS